jgi:Raf kinase inhibitor-like YbhB/YbcL family protein
MRDDTNPDMQRATMIADSPVHAVRFLIRIDLAANAAAAQFTLSSSDFAAGATLADAQAFDGMGCTGDNLSPALSWRGAPAGTKSFALLLHDPDAPTGGAGWWHWIAFDIPATVTALAKGAGKADGSAMPRGSGTVENDYGLPGYGGPCPPEGDKPHRYVFTVYALGVDKLGVPKDANASTAGFMINANALGKASITGMYGRPKK